MLTLASAALPAVSAESRLFWLLGECTHTCICGRERLPVCAGECVHMYWQYRAPHLC